MAFTFKSGTIKEVPVTPRATNPLPFPWAAKCDEAKKGTEAVWLEIPVAYWVQERGLDGKTKKDLGQVLRDRIKASFQGFRTAWEANNKNKFLGVKLAVADQTDDKGEVTATMCYLTKQDDSERKALQARAKVAQDAKKKAAKK
jgi:hypothetical protein